MKKYTYGGTTVVVRAKTSGTHWDVEFDEGKGSVTLEGEGATKRSPFRWSIGIDGVSPGRYGFSPSLQDALMHIASRVGQHRASLAEQQEFDRAARERSAKSASDYYETLDC